MKLAKFGLNSSFVTTKAIIRHKIGLKDLLEEESPTVGYRVEDCASDPSMKRDWNIVSESETASYGKAEFRTVMQMFWFPDDLPHVIPY